MLEALDAYDRLTILRQVAKLEQIICRITKAEAYFDELHDFYEEEIDGYAYANLEKFNDLNLLRRLT